jgi:hypothetical protein
MRTHSVADLHGTAGHTMLSFGLCAMTGNTMATANSCCVQQPKTALLLITDSNLMLLSTFVGCS